MNSKTAQLTENGTEIVRLLARFALGASFLSAVADRCGLWGPYGAKNVAWGDFAHCRLQNTNGLRPRRSSPFVICYGHGDRSWHQDTIRLFGLLGGRCSILTGVLGA
jgi:hypothetical protein